MTHRAQRRHATTGEALNRSGPARFTSRRRSEIPVGRGEPLDPAQVTRYVSSTPTTPGRKGEFRLHREDHPLGERELRSVGEKRVLVDSSPIRAHEAHLVGVSMKCSANSVWPAASTATRTGGGENTGPAASTTAHCTARAASNAASKGSGVARPRTSGSRRSSTASVPDQVDDDRRPTRWVESSPLRQRRRA